MNHEIIIIYESIYNGNTEKIARTIARKLGCRFVQAQQALQEDLSRYKVVGFGSGIYFGTHHPALFEVVDCTLCRLCIQNCGERAIYLHYSWRDAINVAKRHSKRDSL